LVFFASWFRFVTQLLLSYIIWNRSIRRTANSSCTAAASGGSCDGEADLERQEGEPGSIYGERRLVETVRR